MTKGGKAKIAFQPSNYLLSVKVPIRVRLRKELNGRKLVVTEDFDVERDRNGRIIKGSGGGGGRDGRDRGRDRDRDHRDYDRRDRDRDSRGGGGGGAGGYGNTYGLSPQFLSSLGIDGPLHTRLFVANVSCTVCKIKSV